MSFLSFLESFFASFLESFFGSFGSFSFFCLEDVEEPDAATRGERRVSRREPSDRFFFLEDEEDDLGESAVASVEREEGTLGAEEGEEVATTRELRGLRTGLEIEMVSRSTAIGEDIALDLLEADELATTSVLGDPAGLFEEEGIGEGVGEGRGPLADIVILDPVPSPCFPDIADEACDGSDETFETVKAGGA